MRLGSLGIKGTKGMLRTTSVLVLSFVFFVFFVSFVFNLSNSPKFSINFAPYSLPSIISRSSRQLFVGLCASKW